MFRQAQHVNLIILLEVYGGITEYEQLAAPGMHFLKIGLELLQQIVTHCYRHDGHLFIHQRQWPVLKLARGIGLCVDVGDLLEFQRSLHRHGVKRAAT